MNSAGVLTALDILIRLTEQVALLGAMMSKARAENRDLTSEELKSLQTSDDAARIALQALIDKTE